MEITSNSNEKIKNIKKLYMKKYRDEENKYIVEGIKVIEEAYFFNQDFDTIVICEEIYNNVSIEKKYVNKLINKNSDKAIYVSSNVFESICDTKTPQGVLAVINNNNKNELENLDDSNIIFLDNVQDAGNVGTIIRTACAFNFNTVILNNGCADIYSSKVIRSTMGNIFKINCISINDIGISLLEKLKQKGYTFYCTSLNNSNNIYDIKFDKKKVLVIGNEGNGICSEILELSDKNIIIPMNNNLESLNVSVATGIVMSEIRRKELYE